jgi:anaerobic ribonucleoside-triphosphate reductase activating protein
MAIKLNIHAILPNSLVNGPGKRTVIWTQGCSLKCHGCFNPNTHSPDQRTFWDVEKLVNILSDYAPDIEGYTISGGEPLQQILGISALIQGLKHTTHCSIILFTGYSWSEIQAMPERNSILDYVDVVIAGRYIEKQRVAHNLIGSSNKTLHFLSKAYTSADFSEIPQTEVLINRQGMIHISGIDPLQW